MGPIGVWTAAALAVVASGFFLWALLAVVVTPVRLLWKPGVAATEWGHWLAGMALSIAVIQALIGAPGWLLAPALAAAALFLAPLLRGFLAARAIRSRLEAGTGESDDERPDVRQRAPVVLFSLLHIPLPPVRQERHVYREIDGRSLTLDYYEPTTDRQASTLVLVVHGGSWSSGDSSQLAGMNRYLAGCGYPVAAINYRLAPHYRFPAPVEDITSAIAFLDRHRQGAHAAWDRVVLLGRSSGGHLALVAAYQPAHPMIRGVIALYPPTDLEWSWQRPAPGRLMDSNGAIRALMGGSPDSMPDQFAAASPIRQVRAGLPPTLLIHGSKDELVSPWQSRRLAKALDDAGARCIYIELGWGKHGMDANLAGPAGQITLYAIERFLRARPMPAARPTPARAPGSRSGT